MALTYEVVTKNRAGLERARRYTTDDALEPGAIVLLDGRRWLVERVEASRAIAKQARYRLRLRHPDGREERGAFRRFLPGSPRLGHMLTTIDEGRPVSWQVVDERLEHDEEGEPYLALIAERDFGELESLPDHELEHALAAEDEEGFSAVAPAAVARAEDAGLAVELVALEVGRAPDWDESERYLDALILEEIEDDLLELCGVDPDRDPRETWLDTVQARLGTDLERFRADVEGDHDEIEEWDFRGGRVFAAVGSYEDEADPDSGYGWMCRLVDAGVLGSAGFRRVRKAELV